MAGDALLRPAEVGDEAAMAAGLIAGLAGYRDFAPAEWRAPPVADEEAHMRTLLADPHVWACVAEAGGRIVGQVTMLPAGAPRGRPVSPG